MKITSMNMTANVYIHENSLNGYTYQLVNKGNGEYGLLLIDSTDLYILEENTDTLKDCLKYAQENGTLKGYDSMKEYYAEIFLKGED